MKPFDLEAAKRGEPIQTRDGHKAKFVAHLPEMATSHRLIAVVEGMDAPVIYYEDGRHLSKATDSRDLFMAPRKIVEERWILWVPAHGREGFIMKQSFSKENEANASAKYIRHAFIRKITEEFEI